MDTSQWPPQETVIKPLEEIVTARSSCGQIPALAAERPPRPPKEQALNCPRCNSTNTKFCYYNNYSLTQPRYFCKGCRRYWTDGGSLRNIPVGGGSRKNKRSSSSASSKKIPGLVNPSAGKVAHWDRDRDLNLGFPTVPKVIQAPGNIEKTTANDDGTGQVSELLSGITSTSTRGVMDSFIPMPIPDPATIYGSGFTFPDFKPSLSFSLDLIDNAGGFRSLHTGIHESSGGRVFFPFEDLKSVPGDVDHEQQGKEPGDATTGYWTEMLGVDHGKTSKGGDRNNDFC
ncbi:hypothetical protein MLD38_039228 [Melastoma candidum]|uniref:Uncharacterized protein n=1 Tax=Melastoma candidum TaxID=119954 RepID=A0ACB9L2A5_9MYRT|nr:hypothetical protein MLD38_039228 [Melastoma candidum]